LRRASAHRNRQPVNALQHSSATDGTRVGKKKKSTENSERPQKLEQYLGVAKVKSTGWNYILTQFSRRDPVRRRCNLKMESLNDVVEKSFGVAAAGIATAPGRNRGRELREIVIQPVDFTFGHAEILFELLWLSDFPWIFFFFNSRSIKLQMMCRAYERVCRFSCATLAASSVNAAAARLSDGCKRLLPRFRASNGKSEEGRTANAIAVPSGAA